VQAAEENKFLRDVQAFAEDANRQLMEAATVLDEIGG
jgi:hypothetical protein